MLAILCYRVIAKQRGFQQKKLSETLNICVIENVSGKFISSFVSVLWILSEPVRCEHTLAFLSSELNT